MNKFIKCSLFIFIATAIVGGTMTGCASNSSKKSYERSSVTADNNDSDKSKEIKTVEYDKSIFDIDKNVSTIELLVGRDDVSEVKFNTSTKTVMVILDKDRDDVTETQMKELHKIINSDKDYFKEYASIEFISGPAEASGKQVSLVGKMSLESLELIFKGTKITL